MTHSDLVLEPELDPEVVIWSPGFFITLGLKGPASGRCHLAAGFGFYICNIQGWPRLIHLSQVMLIPLENQ